MVSNSKEDITSKEDIRLLIEAFYGKVRKDQVIGRHFVNIDWDHHTPVIINFWSMILLGDPDYKGNPFSKHLHLSLNKTDFERWLQLFTATLDELFKGAKADEAKLRAVAIAGVFQFRMNLS